MKLNKNRTKLRVLGFLLLTIYLGLLAYLVFFSKEFGRQVHTDMRYNIVPFKTITNFYYYSTTKGFVINIFGNLLAFMPLGVLWPIVFKKPYDKVYIHIVLLWSFTISLFIEIIQVLSKVGAFDVDDLILNTVGGFIGYLIYKLLSRRYKAAIRRRKVRSGGR